MRQPKKRPVKYLMVGLALSVFNFGTYTVIARLIFKNNDLLWLATLISTSLTAILAFFLHSGITCCGPIFGIVFWIIHASL